MKYLLLKDKRSRKFFYFSEKKKKCFKFLLLNTKIDNIQRLYISLKINKIRKANITKIKNRCALTNRGRGNLSKFRLSRIKLREFLSLGLIPGYKKAIW